MDHNGERKSRRIVCEVVRDVLNANLAVIDELVTNWGDFDYATDYAYSQVKSLRQYPTPNDIFQNAEGSRSS